MLKAVIFMFIGEYEHSIDSKGRAIIPAKFREELGESCLGVYKPELWNEIVDKLNKLPTTKKSARDYRRFKLAGAGECIPDSNGRIMIPLPLRDYAGITKEIVSIGNGNKVEIWDKERWIRYNSECDFDEADFEGLEEYGI